MHELLILLPLCLSLSLYRTISLIFYLFLSLSNFSPFLCHYIFSIIQLLFHVSNLPNLHFLLALYFLLYSSNTIFSIIFFKSYFSFTTFSLISLSFIFYTFLLCIIIDIARFISISLYYSDFFLFSFF